MTSTAPLLAVVLLAVLVGAAIPVLYQAYQVLKRTRMLLDTAGPRLERALVQVGQAADQLSRIGSTLEAQTQTVKPLLEAASKLSCWISRSGRWLGTALIVGGAVGPAMIAGARALFKRTDGHPLHRRNKGSRPDDQQPRLTDRGATT